MLDLGERARFAQKNTIFQGGFPRPGCRWRKKKPKERNNKVRKEKRKFKVWVYV